MNDYKKTKPSFGDMGWGVEAREGLSEGHNSPGHSIGFVYTYRKCHGFSSRLWSIQIELERDRERDQDQDNWVYRTLCLQFTLQLEWELELRRWVSNPFWNLPADLTGKLIVKLYVVLVPVPLPV